MAERFLNRKGCRTVRRNFHCRAGEIDLIVRDGEFLVFAEIKYRGPSSRASGPEAVTRQKQQRIIRAAGFFLQRHPGLAQRPCRFDVISISQVDGGQNIHWIKAAFTA